MGERRVQELHVSIGGERAELRGVCAAGVLGILEWYGGSRLLLGVGESLAREEAARRPVRRCGARAPRMTRSDSALAVHVDRAKSKN